MLGTLALTHYSGSHLRSLPMDFDGLFSTPLLSDQTFCPSLSRRYSLIAKPVDLSLRLFVYGLDVALSGDDGWKHKSQTVLTRLLPPLYHNLHFVHG